METDRGQRPAEMQSGRSRPTASMKTSPDEPKTVDARYHRHTGKWVTRRISLMARLRIYQHFTRNMEPGPNDRLLDVGASDDTGPDSNILEQLYPHREKLTCASLSNGHSIVAAYPDVRHVPI